MSDRRDSALFDDAIDAAKVTDDFVRGVLENLGGRAGGAEHVDRGWRRFLQIGGGRISGERAVVQAFGARYAPDQLRKAAAAADELVEAVGALAGAWTPAAAEAIPKLTALALDELPWMLREGDPTQARAAHERLSSALGIMNEARTRAILFEMRQARDQREHPSE